MSDQPERPSLSAIPEEAPVGVRRAASAARRGRPERGADTGPTPAAGRGLIYSLIALSLLGLGAASSALALSPRLRRVETLRLVRIASPAAGLVGAIAYVVVANQTTANAATTAFIAAGANMSKVVFIIQPNNSVWMRDYGPHFVWQNGTLAVVDSHYYPTRPADNFIPTLVGDGNGYAAECSLSPDGRTLLYTEVDPKTQGDLWVMDMPTTLPAGYPLSRRSWPSRRAPASAPRAADARAALTARAAKVAGFPVKVESGAATMEGWVISIVKACGK